MKLSELVITLFSTVSLLAVVQALVSLWISERLKAALQLENARVYEALRWEVRVREQAAKVAEYLATIRELREDDPPDRYREVNRMSWELALWLPADVYRAMGQALVAPSSVQNELTVLLAVREHLLGTSAGDLTQDEIGVHGPGIGKYRNIAKHEG
jgi:hypothetical protein